MTRGSERSLVLVAGSGRSGTSLISGILQRLGYTVPQPEVPADPTNPRGFAESQWVVDFHAKLLRGARVQTSDARPAAWAITAKISLDEEVLAQLRTWLEQQFAIADHLVIKDPRLSWFLPLWRRVASDLGVPPRFVTMLRHPGAVVDSKQRWYGGWQGDVSRAAGWVHQTLFTERATRDSPRVFVRYEDLLEDWTRTVGRVGEVLDLAPVRDAPAAAMRDVHGFVDRGLSRSRSGWGDLKLPAGLQAQADEVWDLVLRLASEDAPADADAVATRLDELRADYVELYEQAEAVAQSSVAAAQRGTPVIKKPPPPRAIRLARRVPKPVRHAIPVSVRARIARALKGARGAARVARAS